MAAASEGPSVSSTRKARRYWQALSLLLVVAAGVVVLRPKPGLHTARPAAVVRELVVLNAAQGANLASPFRLREHPTASARQSLGVPLGAGKPPEAVEGRVAFAFEVRQPGTYTLWLRAWWTDACANSVAAACDAGAPELAGNDGTYGAWHWVRGPQYRLDAGAHVLNLSHREDGIELDQLALCNDGGFEPQGVLEGSAKIEAPPRPEIPSQPPVEPAVVKPEPATPVQPPQELPRAVETLPPAPPEPSAVEAPAQPLQPYTIAICGCYRDGFEMHLVALGVPYIRLRETELDDPEKLKQIDLLIAGDPRPAGGPAAFYRAVYAMLKAGKTVILEDPPEGAHPAAADPDNLFLRRDAPDGSGRVKLLADGSDFFKDVPRERAYALDVRCHWLPEHTDIPGAKIFGFVKSSRRRGGALLVREHGPGRLYFMAFPAAFAAFWRERTPDPYLFNILRHAVNGRAPFRLEGFAYAPRVERKVGLADDFMRAPGQPGGWQVLGGSFELIGPRDGGEDAFALRGRGTGAAAIGQANWVDYRPMAAVRLARGAAGIWHGTPDGGRLCLRLSDRGARVTLAAVAPGGGEKILASATVPAYPNGWRRLALVHREQGAAGWVDGAEVLRVPVAPAPVGRCGLEILDGEALFDDFRAVDLAALQPGRDVAPGEEASVRCMDRYGQRCFERHSIYAPQWMLEPDPRDRGRARLALPVFAGAGVRCDAAPALRVPAGTELPLFRLPENRAPQFDLAYAAPGWRDFHFAGRVTDWHASSGEWAQLNRWSCSPEYQWYGGKSAQVAALWYKHAVHGPVGVEALLAPRADEQFGEERNHGLNLCLYGNGRDLSEGYLFTVGPPREGCRILRNGRELARAPGIGLPEGHALHHAWFSVRATAADGKLKFWFDRRLVLETSDPQPLTQGRVALWTERNKISVGRATLAIQP